MGEVARWKPLLFKNDMNNHLLFAKKKWIIANPFGIKKKKGLMRQVWNSLGSNTSFNSKNIIQMIKPGGSSAIVWVGFASP